MTDLKLEPFDVVVVPFPFTDRNASKRRPALVLTSSEFNQKAAHSVLAMITSPGNPAGQATTSSKTCMRLACQPNA